MPRRGPAAAAAAGGGESEAENVNWRPCLCLPCPLLALLLFIIFTLSSAFYPYSSAKSFLNRMSSVLHPGIPFEVSLTVPLSHWNLPPSSFPPKIYFSHEIRRASFSSHSCGIKIFSEICSIPFQLHFQFWIKPSCWLCEDEWKRLGFLGICPATHFNLNRWQLWGCLGNWGAFPITTVTRAIHQEGCQGVQMNTKDLVSFAPHFVQDNLHFPLLWLRQF